MSVQPGVRPGTPPRLSLLSDAAGWADLAALCQRAENVIAQAGPPARRTRLG